MKTILRHVWRQASTVCVWTSGGTWITWWSASGKNWHWFASTRNQKEGLRILKNHWFFRIFDMVSQLRWANTEKAWNEEIALQIGDVCMDDLKCMRRRLCEISPPSCYVTSTTLWCGARPRNTIRCTSVWNMFCTMKTSCRCVHDNLIAHPKHMTVKLIWCWICLL